MRGAVLKCLGMVAVLCSFAAFGCAAQNTATGNVPITVNPAPLTITVNGTPTPATAGTAYSLALSSIWQIGGGVAPYSFAVTAGSLPPGLTLSASGVISGTPTTPGSYSATVTVTDSAGNAGKGELTFATPTKNPRVVKGSLPPGLKLTSAGKIEGTPTTPGLYTFTVMASDAKGLVTYHTYSMEVKPSAGVLLAENAKQ